MGAATRSQGHGGTSVPTSLLAPLLASLATCSCRRSGGEHCVAVTGGSRVHEKRLLNATLNFQVNM